MEGVDHHLNDRFSDIGVILQGAEEIPLEFFRHGILLWGWGLRFPHASLTWGGFVHDCLLIVKEKNTAIMSKIDLSLDFDRIISRIDDDRRAYKPSVWAKNIGISKNIVTNIHGKTKQKPSIEYVVAVSRHTGKSVEWYLFGEKAEREGGQDMGKKTLPECTEEVYVAEARLKSAIALQGDLLAKKMGYGSLGGMDAVVRYLCDKHHWLPHAVRSLSADDLNLLLEGETRVAK